MRPLFTQERVAISAGQFLDGLLGEERRTTGWMWAEAAGDLGPGRQQALLGDDLYAPSDSQNEQRRSTGLAHPDPRAHS